VGLIDGFYVADPIYCNEANLAKMFICFNDGDGYIYIQGVDGNVLLADSFKYKLRGTSWNFTVNKSVYNISFSEIDHQDFFPTKMTMEYVPKINRIKLYTKKDMALHGVLFKDGSLSDV
jgi:hypothetical protein